MSTAFERITIGVPRIIGAHTFTAGEIKRFASAWDPQRFHMDEAEAEASSFGALAASGWHTASAMMRLLVDTSPAMPPRRWRAARSRSSTGRRRASRR